MRTAISIDPVGRNILDSSTVDILKEDLGIENPIRIPRRMCVMNGSLRLKPKMEIPSLKWEKDQGLNRLVQRLLSTEPVK